MNFLFLFLLILKYIDCFFPNDFPRAFFADLLFPNFEGQKSVSHLEMSKKAIFDFIIDTFQKMDSSKQPERMSEIIKSLEKTTNRFSREYISVDKYVYHFSKTIQEILDSNEKTDLNKNTIDNPIFHFDAEFLQETNDRLITQKKDIISNLEQNEYKKAREQIGQYFHTLQDFYSHSNWIEMNNTDINSDIGERKFRNIIASKEDPTCVNCSSESNCQKNIISNINENKILTSGYFWGQILNNQPISKPKNKCSHGGYFDKTRKIEPYGGINKDGSVEFFSEHFFLHRQAAILAIKASNNFLKDIQSKVGIQKSLCIFNINCIKNFVFLIDATGSMEFEIGSAKLNALRIFIKLYNNLNTLNENINATIAYFGDNLFLKCFTNINNLSEFNRILSLIDAKQPDPIKKPICINFPFFYCYCCEYDYSNRNSGRELINSRLLYLLEIILAESDVFLFTDTLPSDEFRKNEVIYSMKTKNVRFSCAFCNLRFTRSLGLNLYHTYVEITSGSYENNGNLVIPELDLNEQLYSVFIFKSDSFFGQIYIDSFIKNLTIDIKTKGSYSIDDQNFENDSKNFLKLGNVYLNFNLTETFTIDIYGINDFFIDYRFYQVMLNSSHPGYIFFDQPLSGSQIGVSFSFSSNDLSDNELNLTQLSILDFETDMEIAKSTIDWYSGMFDANITVPNKKSYFKIQGIDSNGMLFQRYLKQIPFEPILYSIFFERNQTNNFKNKYDIIVNTSNRYLSTIGIELLIDKNNLVYINITQQNLNLSYDRSAIFSCQFYITEQVQSEIKINILPVIYVNNTENIFLNIQTINLYSTTNSNKSLEESTEIQMETKDNLYQDTTSHFQNLIITTDKSNTESELYTFSELKTFKLSDTTINLDKTTKNIKDDFKSENFMIKIIKLISWFINYIIVYFF